MVLTALAGLGMMMVGYRVIGATAKNGDKSKPIPASRVAPIFVHGEGRGAFGCVAVNPPVFLCEEEARQVITEEAKKSGILLEPDARTVSKVPLPVTDRYAFVKRPSKQRTQSGSLQLDGTDRKRAVSYEFVSCADFDAWEHKDSGLVSTACAVNLQQAASVLVDGLKQAQRRGSYAVFYDPMCRTKDVEYVEDESGQIDWKATDAVRAEIEAQAAEESRALLREQVKDFIKWLKAEGVI